MSKRCEMSWKNKPTEFIRVIEQDLTQTQKKIVADTLQGVVLASPVDTGAFRGNHRVSIGSVDATASSSEKDSSGAGTISKGLQNLIALKPFQTVFIKLFALRLSLGKWLVRSSTAGHLPNDIYIHYPKIRWLRWR